MPAAPDDFDYATLLIACAAGDQAALHRLYEFEGSRMLGVALRIVRVRALAEDVVHDAFVNIWRRASSFDPERGNGRGWIYAVLRNLAISAIRNRSDDVDLDETALEAREAVLSIQAHRDSTDAFELNDDLGRLRQCLEALDPARRSCVLHAYVNGCTHVEIAQRLSLPLGTVKTWVRRSLVSLRECMS